MAKIRQEFYLCYLDANGAQICKNFSDPDYAVQHWNQLQQLGHKQGYLFCGDSAETAAGIETNDSTSLIDYNGEYDYIVIDPKGGTWDRVTAFDGHKELRQNPTLLGFQERDSDI